LHGDFEARRERATDFQTKDSRPNPPYLTGFGILGVLRQEQSNPNLAALHEVGDPWVETLLLRLHYGHANKQSCHSENGMTIHGASPPVF
jgi:hypothetical protein